MMKYLLVGGLMFILSVFGVHYTITSGDCYGSSVVSMGSSLMAGDCQVPLKGEGRYYFKGSADYEYTEYGQNSSNPTVGDANYCDATLNPNDINYAENCCPNASVCNRPTMSGGVKIQYQSRPKYVEYKKNGTLSVSGNIVNSGESTYLQGNSNIRDKNGSKMNFSSGRNSIETSGGLAIDDSMVFNNSRGQITSGRNSVSKSGAKRLVMTNFENRDDATFDQFDARDIQYDGVVSGAAGSDHSQDLGEVTSVTSNDKYFFYTDKSTKKITRIGTDKHAQSFGGNNWNWSPEGIEVDGDQVYVTSGESEGALDMFRVTTPEQDAVYDAGSNIVISWTKVASAKSYNVVHENSRGEKRELSVMPGSTSYNYKVGPESNGLNYFAVTAHDENGRIIGKTNNNVLVNIGAGSQNDFRIISPSHGSKFQYDQHIRFSWTKVSEADEYYLFCMKEGSRKDLLDKGEVELRPGEGGDGYGYDVEASTGISNETFFITGDASGIKKGLMSDGYYNCKVYAMKYDLDSTGHPIVDADGERIINPISATNSIEVEVRGGLRLPPGADEEKYCESHVCSADASFSREYFYGSQTNGGSNASNNVSTFQFTNESDQQSASINSFLPDPSNLKAVEAFNIMKEYMENPTGSGYVDSMAMSLNNPKGMSNYEGHLYVADSGYDRIVRISSSLYVPLDLANALMRVKAIHGRGWQKQVDSVLKNKSENFWQVVDMGVEDFAKDEDGNWTIPIKRVIKNPSDVLVDETGIYVAATDSKRLYWKKSGSTEWKIIKGIGLSWHPISLYKDDNILYVTDADKGRITKINIPGYEARGMVNGDTYFQFGRKGTEEFEFNSPAGVAKVGETYLIPDTYGAGGQAFDTGRSDGMIDSVSAAVVGWYGYHEPIQKNKGPLINLTNPKKKPIPQPVVADEVDASTIPFVCSGDRACGLPSAGGGHNVTAISLGEPAIEFDQVITDTAWATVHFYWNAGGTWYGKGIEHISPERNSNVARGLGYVCDSDPGPMPGGWVLQECKDAICAFPPVGEIVYYKVVDDDGVLGRYTRASPAGRFEWPYDFDGFCDGYEDPSKFRNDANANIRIGHLITEDVYTSKNGNKEHLTQWAEGPEISHCQGIDNQGACNNSNVVNTSPSSCTGQWELEPIQGDCTYYDEHECCSEERDSIEGMEEICVDNPDIVLGEEGDISYDGSGDYFDGDREYLSPVNEAGDTVDSDGDTITFSHPDYHHQIFNRTEIKDGGETCNDVCTKFCCVGKTLNCAVGVSISPKDYAVKGVDACGDLEYSKTDGWPTRTSSLTGLNCN